MIRFQLAGALLLGTAVALSGATGCDRPTDASPTSRANSTGFGSAQPAQANGSTGPEYADEDLPVPADFEADAERDISEENYEAALAEIETELDAGAPAVAATSAADAGAAAPPPDAGTSGKAAADGPGQPKAPEKAGAKAQGPAGKAGAPAGKAVGPAPAAKPPAASPPKPAAQPYD